MNWQKINAAAAEAAGISPARTCFNCDKPVTPGQEFCELTGGAVMHTACREALENRLAEIAATEDGLRVVLHDPPEVIL